MPGILSLHSPHSQCQALDRARVQKVTQPSLTELRAAVMNGALLAFTIKAPASPVVVGKQEPGHSYRSQGQLWPVEGEPRNPDTDSSGLPPGLAFLAALWHHLLGTLQSPVIQSCQEEGRTGHG